jgi:hypothetical protein
VVYSPECSGIAVCAPQATAALMPSATCSSARRAAGLARPVALEGSKRRVS